MSEIASPTLWCDSIVTSSGTSALGVLGEQHLVDGRRGRPSRSRNPYSIM